MQRPIRLLFGLLVLLYASPILAQTGRTATLVQSNYQDDSLGAGDLLELDLSGLRLPQGPLYLQAWTEHWVQGGGHSMRPVRGKGLGGLFAAFAQAIVAPFVALSNIANRPRMREDRQVCFPISPGATYIAESGMVRIDQLPPDGKLRILIPYLGMSTTSAVHFALETSDPVLQKLEWLSPTVGATHFDMYINTPAISFRKGTENGATGQWVKMGYQLPELIKPHYLLGFASLDDHYTLPVRGGNLFSLQKQRGELEVFVPDALLGQQSKVQIQLYLQGSATFHGSEITIPSPTVPAKRYILNIHQITLKEEQKSYLKPGKLQLRAQIGGVTLPDSITLHGKGNRFTPPVPSVLALPCTDTDSISLVFQGDYMNNLRTEVRIAAADLAKPKIPALPLHRHGHDKLKKLHIQLLVTTPTGQQHKAKLQLQDP